MNAAMVVMQTAAAVAAAPLLSGAIRKLKNLLRMKQGAPMLQPYYTLAKLFAKQEVVSEHASWVFRAAPYVVFGATVCGLGFIPVFFSGHALTSAGDCFALVLVLALARFFMALAGLDTGSAFGGMGSSREVFIASLAEPVMGLSLAVAALNCGSTSIGAFAAVGGMKLSTLLAAGGLYFVTLAETSRIPVDNQETHLELTMVHEAMVLEYSGRRLALLELSHHAKQLLFYSLLAVLLWPSGGVKGFILLVAAIGAGTAVLEVSLAKMRLFRVVDFLAFGFSVALLALVVHGMGM